MGAGCWPKAPHKRVPLFGQLGLSPGVAPRESVKENRIDVHGVCMTWPPKSRRITGSGASDLDLSIQAVTKCHSVLRGGDIDSTSLRGSSKVPEEHVGQEMLLWPP